MVFWQTWWYFGLKSWIAMVFWQTWFFAWYFGTPGFN
jgi:hypothetical protein